MKYDVIIREFAKGEGIPRLDIASAVKVATDLLQFAEQSDGLFLAYDALGCYPNRTKTQEHLYQALRHLSAIRDKGGSIQ